MRRKIWYDRESETFLQIFLETKALFTSTQKTKIFQDSPSHRIFIHMHGALNIDENKKTNYTVWSELTRRIFWSLLVHG